jgi:hypothetical protein
MVITLVQAPTACQVSALTYHPVAGAYVHGILTHDPTTFQHMRHAPRRKGGALPESTALGPPSDEHIQQRHYGMKMKLMVYTLIDLRDFCIP